MSTSHLYLPLALNGSLIAAFDALASDGRRTSFAQRLTHNTEIPESDFRRRTRPMPRIRPDPSV
jgi:hypothetical protein